MNISSVPLSHFEIVSGTLSGTAVFHTVIGYLAVASHCPTYF